MWRKLRHPADRLRQAIHAAFAPAKRHTFVQATHSLGTESNFHWDKALAAADAIEDEELIRKTAVHK